MGFFSKLKEGLTKTRKSLTEKIEKVIIGYADIDDDLFASIPVSMSANCLFPVCCKMV